MSIIDFIGSEIVCNDITNNGIYTGGNSNGLEIRDLTKIGAIITGGNIVENNLIGLLISNILGDDFFSFSISYNFIGFNDRGLVLNYTNESSVIRFNDFDQNNLQALDTGQGVASFTHNWWSDYSPTCVDGPPADGWCDVNRPIPVANQDVQPKAGAWWGHKNRGYFVRANPGVVPKQSCQTITLPPLPVITVPSFESPQGPIITSPIEPGLGGGGGGKIPPRNPRNP